MCLQDVVCVFCVGRYGRGCCALSSYCWQIASDRASGGQWPCQAKQPTPSSEMFYVFSFTHLNFFCFVCVSTFSFWTPSTVWRNRPLPILWRPASFWRELLLILVQRLKQEKTPKYSPFVLFLSPFHSLLCAFHTLKTKTIWFFFFVHFRIVYFIAVALTAAVFINERKQGLLDRSLVAGIAFFSFQILWHLGCC